MRPTKMEEQQNNESLFRINVKQTAKGFSYYDVTAKGNTIEELKERLEEIIVLAETACAGLNSSHHSEDTSEKNSS